MGKIRVKFSGRYNIPKHKFLYVYHFVLDKYPEWMTEYKAIQDTRRSTTYGNLQDGKSGADDPTSSAGLRLAYLSKQIDIINDAAKEAGGDLWEYIIKAATIEGYSYISLRERDHIPCGKDMYYAARRKFYWLLSKRLDDRGLNHGDQKQ